MTDAGKLKAKQGKPLLGWRVTQVSRSDAFGPDRAVWKADASYHDMTLIGSFVARELTPDYARFAFGDTEAIAREAVLALCRADKKWPVTLE